MPLAFAQLYFYAPDSKSKTIKTITAMIIMMVTLATLAGILSASMGM
ncbi:MAG: hypothetical protein P8I03_03990 [Thalassotalea sp.]|nr:hypothetical protein [Thalassotalea sp.]